MNHPDDNFAASLQKELDRMRSLQINAPYSDEQIRDFDVPGKDLTPFELELKPQYFPQTFGEWQLCPKCNGSGMAPNYKNQIPTNYDCCDVCRGAKIIARPIL